MLLRPATTALISAAQHAAMADVDSIRVGRDGLLAAGAEIAGLDLEDPHIAAGLAHALMLRALARYLVMDWDGVFDREGQPIAFDPALLPQLMAIEDVAAAFWAELIKPERSRAAEGNASAPSPNGTSAGALATAGAAANRRAETPAPTGSMPH
ncbi:MAG: hypothetical protein N2688_00155 [Burkholderiaceae bacterium]|nr:hypothetical protein [Burkholderiaceae bacterium]